jgi:VWFA-related protein
MADKRRGIFPNLAVVFGMLMLLLPFPNLFPEGKKAKKEDPATSQTTFKVPVGIVVVNATVTDKSGNPVTNLTAKDFKIYEDGKLQEIQTFALESYGPAEAEKPEIQAASPEHTAKPKVKSSDRTIKERNLPGRSPDERNATRSRLISFVIDDLTLYSSADFPRLIEAAKDFVKNDMGPMDQVSMLSGSGNVQFPFSNDKQQVLDGLTESLRKLNQNISFRQSCPTLTDYQAWRLSDATQAWDIMYPDKVEETRRCLLVSRARRTIPQEEVIGYLGVRAREQNQQVQFQTRNLLLTIRQHMRALRHFEGAKAVVIFSDGFIAEKNTPEAYQFQEIIDLALRSGIVLNCVNIQGLATYLDVSKTEPTQMVNSADFITHPGDPRDPSTIEDQAERTRQERLQEAEKQAGIDYMAKLNPMATRVTEGLDDTRAQEDPLAQMAHDTGGEFVNNSNNMYKQVQNIVRRQSYYYILSYGMPLHKADGSLHNIKLEVARPDLELSYRKGYYTAKEELSFENRKKEDIIAALNGPGNMNEIPMTLAYNYSQEEDSTYSVSFQTSVNIRKIKFLEEENRQKNLISLVLAAFDENDKYINGLEKTIDFRLQESNYESLRDHGLKSRVELKLPIGRYKIKAVVRESTEGKMGSVTKAVEIP